MAIVATACYVAQRNDSECCPVPVVYMATNLLNGKRYIGYTKHPIGYRRARHIYVAKAGTSKARFAKAIIKHGEGMFHWRVLWHAETEQEARRKEVEIISVLRPEYNVRDGGESGPAVAWNRRPIICLNDGLVFTSGDAADRHYGLFQHAANESARRMTIAKGLHFARYSGPLTEQERTAEIERRRHVRVQRRKQGSIVATGRQPQSLCDAAGRSMAGPMSVARSVICLDDGEQFESASAAAKTYGLPKSGVIELCLGKRGRKTIGGLRFAYLESAGGNR